MRISYTALEVLLSLLCMAKVEHPNETIFWGLKMERSVAGSLYFPAEIFLAKKVTLYLAYQAQQTVFGTSAYSYVNLDLIGGLLKGTLRI
jgi:hypothetical protein